VTLEIIDSVKSFLAKRPTLKQRVAYGAKLQELYREAARSKLDRLLERLGTDEVMQGLMALEECFDDTPLMSSAALLPTEDF
jgi:ABC-type Na+ transport system ATPase subunit NatA